MPELAAKPWYQSKTIWGAIIMFLAVGLKYFTGKELDTASQKELVDLLVILGGLIGSGLAIWGRIAAKKPISAGKNGKAIIICLALSMLVFSAGCGGKLSKKSGSLTCPADRKTPCKFRGQDVAPGATVTWNDEITDASEYYAMLQGFEKIRKPIFAINGANKISMTASAGKSISLKIYQTRQNWPVTHQHQDLRWKHAAQMVSQAGAVVTAGLGFYFGYKTVDAIVNSSGGVLGSGGTPSVNNSGSGNVNVGTGNTGTVNQNPSTVTTTVP